MAPQQFFSQQWAARVEEVLFSRENEGSRATSNEQLPRVRKFLLSENEKAYIPESFSLGHSLSAFVQTDLFVVDINDTEPLLPKMYKELSPFDLLRKIPERTITTQPHLLACMHAIVSQFLKFQHSSTEPTPLQELSSFIGQYVVEKVCSIFFCFTQSTAGELPIKSHTAGELAMAGIKFKPLSDKSDNINIRFDKNSLTIYLPRMTITSTIQTEVFFRNLLEWEHVAQGSSLKGFINLMHCLIYTADDVLVLRKSCVISPRSSLTDKEIAKLWDNMRQSSLESTSVLELKQQLKEVLLKRYYRTKIIIKINEKKKDLSKLFHEFRKLYFSKPWKAIALLVGTFILVMNMVVAYCTLWGCNSDRYMKSSGSVADFVY